MGLLIRGSVGDAVRSLQENLTSLGYTVEADGIYGAATEKAVREFQDAYGLAADGAAGINTMTKIAELMNEIAGMKGDDNQSGGDVNLSIDDGNS